MKLKQLSVLMVFLYTSVFVAQELELPEIKVLARSKQDKVMLRWTPNTPYAWRKANDVGYYIERVTITRNGEPVLPLETITLNQIPIKPVPLEEWESLAKADDNAAVLAQAIYGKRFDVSAQVGINAVMEAKNEQEQRFTFGLLAAEQSYEAAKLAGLGYEDICVVSGERYLYRVKIANMEVLDIKEGSVYAGTDMYEELPKPLDFAVVYGDSEVQISWNFSLLKNTYTSYQVEKSEDGNTYKPLNKKPIFNAEKNTEDPALSLFMVDSIPNGKTFYYRVNGITSFGEVGPTTDAIKGEGRELLKYNPHITYKDIVDDKTAVIEWEFPEEGEDKITGFQLQLASSATGKYGIVKDNLSPQTRKTTFSGLQRVNYFKVVAIGKNGTANPSFAALVQPVDSIPPKAPLNLQGTIDTLGVVQLNWNKNVEPDLAGYRVYRSNNKDVEFTQITGSVYDENIFIDTIPVKNLNKHIYYKVLAEDQRYNASEFSEILTIDKPDLSPPSAPVIEEYTVTKEGIKLKFIPSSDEDVISHIIYRKKQDGVTDVWEQLAVLDSTMLNEYTDETIKSGRYYSYTITAKDKGELESTPATPVSLRTQREIIKADAIRFNGIVNRELRIITLIWNVKTETVIEYKLYRGIEGKQLKLFKTIAGTTNRYEDNELEINTNYQYGLQVVTSGGVLSEIKEIQVTY